MIDAENTMSIAATIYEQVKALPEPLAREVLDFVGFLRERRDRGEWRNLMNAQAVALALLPDNHPDVAPESLFLQITALREAEPAAS
jgi:hypothetical protein